MTFARALEATSGYAAPDRDGTTDAVARAGGVATHPMVDFVASVLRVPLHHL
ncbi:MAG TPA: hypothetical protein VMU34_12100 [Mycobacterium sp.]|nr:hypothetical protein [Mycobacterium sp.]